MRKDLLNVRAKYNYKLSWLSYIYMHSEHTAIFSGILEVLCGEYSVRKQNHRHTALKWLYMAIVISCRIL